MAPSETVHLYSLIHWPSAVLVLGITLGVLMIWQPSTRWRRFLAFISNRSKDANRPANTRRQQALAGFFNAASRSALVAGLTGELLGIVMILTADKTPAAMEPGITLATISLFYGFGLSELVFQQLRKRTTPDVTAAVPEKSAGTSRPRAMSYEL
jgi:flagellar motor component MotA